MSLFDQVRATNAAATSTNGGLTNRVSTRANSLLGGAGSNVLGQGLNARGKIINQASDKVTGALSNAIGSLDPNSAGGKLAGGIAEQLGIGAPRKKANLPSAGTKAIWTPAPHWGGLKGNDYFDLFHESAMTAKAWKNLFWVSIEDRNPNGASRDLGSMWNMLATDVTFGPATMPGEAVSVGGANIDKLTGTERTEVRITTLDDSRGSIKRWFLGKAAQVADSDGSFGLPVDYLVKVRITHMAPTNQGSDDARLRHVFLMRPGTIEFELSRTEAALESLQMSFVQFDTFMEAR